MASDLRVVLATAGKAPLLGRTLASLAECELPGIYRETIVVGNGPRTDAKSIVNSRKNKLNTRYVHAQPANKCNALNVALRDLDDGCLVVFADDDIRFDCQVLSRYASAASGIYAGRYFGGPFGVDYEEHPPAWLVKYLPYSAQGWQPKAEDAQIGDGSFLGFNWAAFVGDIRRAGMFDPALGPGETLVNVGDETDMQRRLRRHDVRPQFVPDAMVWHYVQAERCSPNWAIDRAFRSGVGKSLCTGRRGAALAAATCAEAVKFGSRWMRLGMAKILGDAEIAFNYEWKFAATRGRLKGYWLARNHNRTEALASLDEAAGSAVSGPNAKAA